MVTPWPCSHGGTPDNPTEDLFWIINRANDYAPEPDRTQVITKACHCALNHDVTGGAANPTWDTAAKHCGFITQARADAGMDDWGSCKKALDHLGGGGETRSVRASEVEAVAREGIEFSQRLAEWLRNLTRRFPPRGGPPTPPSG